MSNVKRLWIGIGVLTLLSPLGLILPALFKSEGAWGEWDLEKIGKIAGFVPVGMKRFAESWKAPLSDYGIPGQNKGLLAESFGYIVAALIGVAFTAGIMYFVSKVVGKKNNMK